MRWKMIEDFPRYAVSDTGLVKNIETETVLKHQYKEGYATVNLYNYSGMKTCSVHVLVAKAFIPNPQCLPEVNHKDEDRSNPAADNLEWCTSSYNKQYSCGNKGKRIEQYKGDTLLHTYVSLGEASRATGIPTSSICRCCQNKCYHKTAGGFTWRYAL